MAKPSRLKPRRVAEKLRNVRTALGLSQNEMINRLGLAEELIREELSAFERGIRQPPLGILLGYARMAWICVDVLIDDELELPDKIPSTPKHQGIKKVIKARLKQ